MSVELMAKALRTKLPTAQKFLLLILGDNTDDEGMFGPSCEPGAYFPSLEYLEERCSLTRKEVIDCLEALEKAGCLERDSMNDELVFSRAFVEWKIS
ncbi:MAG: helix-turn-helix domain-containing protein [Zoogloeaceae bacterium]|jgi:hypothetical protein|nr:helix-turn-helix domain-containing protein [Zoogloeaceae bacterium]